MSSRISMEQLVSTAKIVFHFLPGKESTLGATEWKKQLSKNNAEKKHLQLSFSF